MTYELKRGLNWWHESIMDWMLANPDKTLTECAVFHNVSLPWLSQVINNDCFKAKYAERRGEHAEMLSTDIISKVEGLALLSVEVLEERIRKEKDTIGLGIVRETADMALKACGYIAPKKGLSVTVNVANVAPHVIAEARERMAHVSSAPLEQQAALPAPQTPETIQ